MWWHLPSDLHPHRSFPRPTPLGPAAAGDSDTVALAALDAADQAVRPAHPPTTGASGQPSAGKPSPITGDEPGQPTANTSAQPAGNRTGQPVEGGTDQPPHNGEAQPSQQGSQCHPNQPRHSEASGTGNAGGDSPVQQQQKQQQQQQQQRVQSASPGTICPPFLSSHTVSSSPAAVPRHTCVRVALAKKNY